MIQTAKKGVPPRPVKSGGPLKTAKYYGLYQRVLAAIHALPNHFDTVLNIEGVAATDLFTLNTALGASIEQSMVDCLNRLRDVWDPKDEYSVYRFVRQAQTFPDVRLQTDEPTAADPIIFGIELKGNSPTRAVIDGRSGQMSTRGRSRPNPTRQV